MPLPKNIRQYEAEWLDVAAVLAQKGELKLNVGDPKQAFRMRQRFYGFRKALAGHDANNPFLGALMETVVTVDGQGNLLLQRSPMSTLLRGMLEHTDITQEIPGELTANLPRSRTDPLLDVLVDIGMVRGGDEKAS